MRSSLLIGNWKLHGTSESIATLLNQLQSGITNSRQLNTTKVIVLPPAIFISQVAQHLQNSPIAWGGQDMSEYREGAYTGQVSGTMLSAFGCQYVLLGHSECRLYHHDSDERIVRKLLLAQEIGLIPILCLGETLQQYESGQTEAVLRKQLHYYLALGEKAFKNIILAYEPIWAIGTRQSVDPEHVQIIHKKLRAEIACHISTKLADQIWILYGGGIGPDNADVLFSMPDIDGGLVGGASLSGCAFLKIYRSLS